MSNQAQKLGQEQKSVPRSDWGTPDPLYQWLSKYFDFTLDAAASKKNAKCKKYYTKKKNAFRKNWKVGAKGGDVWLNHPYVDHKKWIKKCNKEAKRGLTICNLGPADFTTDYFELYYKYATGIYLINGRIKFVGAAQFATFFSGIYVFGYDKLAPHFNPEGEKIVLLTGLSPYVRGGSRK